MENSWKIPLSLSLSLLRYIIIISAQLLSTEFGPRHHRRRPGAREVGRRGHDNISAQFGVRHGKVFRSLLLLYIERKKMRNEEEGTKEGSSHSLSLSLCYPISFPLGI